MTVDDTAQAKDGVLDTSVIVAIENSRPIDVEALPERQWVTVITAAELRVGILAAPDTETRARRMSSFSSYSTSTVLPVDDAAAEQWARLRYRLAETGRRINVNDLWIASIALANDLPVVTRDQDFQALVDLGGPELIIV